MNSQIQKLAKQAGFAYEPSETLQKFASLIVAECLSMSDELKAQYLSFRKNTMDFDEKHIYAEGEAACDTLKYKIKQHFGVEE